MLSHVQLFITPTTVAHQAPLSMGFFRQEYWSGLPFSTPGDLPDPGIKPGSGISCIGRRVLYHCVTCVAHKLTDDDPNGLSSGPPRLFPTQTLCGSWNDYSFLETSSQSLQHNTLCYLLLLHLVFIPTPSPGLLFLYPSLCKCESSPKFPFLTNFSSCSTDFPISNGLHHSMTPIISLGQHFQNSSPVQLSLLNIKPKFPFLTCDIFI